MGYERADIFHEEVDLSFFIAALGRTVTGFFGTANRGPLNTPTLVHDEQDWIENFGTPVANSNSYQCARSYFQKASDLLVVRVAAATAVEADCSFLTSGVSTIDFTALTPGTWYNGAVGPPETGVVLRTAQGTLGVGFYKLTVSVNGSIEEIWDDIPEDAATDIAAILAESEYITGTPGTAGQTLLPIVQEIALGAGTAGNDGIAGIVDTDYIGLGGAVTTGLQLLRATGSMDVDLVVCPNIQSFDATVYAELVSIADAREDLIVIPDNPTGFIVTEDGGVIGVDEFWRGTSAHAEEPVGGIDSSFLATYFPWITIYDHYNSADLDIPPAAACAGAITYSDYSSYPWWAPAGVKRGGLAPLVTDLQYHMLDGELDTLQSDNTKGATNPIIVLDGDFYIMGQKTMLRSNSMLNRINTRRLVNKIKQNLTTQLADVQWQPNDEYSWRQFVALCTPQLAYLKAREGLAGFDIECGLGTTMTADDVAQGKMIGRIVLYLMPTAEKLVFTYVVVGQDAEFQ